MRGRKVAGGLLVAAVFLLAARQVTGETPKASSKEEQAEALLGLKPKNKKKLKASEIEGSPADPGNTQTEVSKERRPATDVEKDLIEATKNFTGNRAPPMATSFGEGMDLSWEPSKDGTSVVIKEVGDRYKNVRIKVGEQMLPLSPGPMALSPMEFLNALPDEMPSQHGGTAAPSPGR